MIELSWGAWLLIIILIILMGALGLSLLAARVIETK
jgi:hypothetical protein